MNTPTPKYQPPKAALNLSDLYEYSYDNWDMDGARRITPATIRAAADVLGLISNIAAPPEVAPAADGTVCMEWPTPAGLLWVDVGPDRTASVLKKINGKPEEKRFVIDAEKRELREYLQAAFDGKES